MSNRPAQTPVLDLLRGVPADARMVYEENPTHHHMIPVGALARQAADEIERLRAALIAAMEIVQRDRVRTAEKVKNGASPNILHWIDAVIAQANAALGSDGCPTST